MNAQSDIGMGALPPISHVNSRISDVVNTHLVLHITLQVMFHYTALIELMASHWSPT